MARDPHEVEVDGVRWWRQGGDNNKAWDMNGGDNQELRKMESDQNGRWRMRLNKVGRADGKVEGKDLIGVMYGVMGKSSGRGRSWVRGQAVVGKKCIPGRIGIDGLRRNRLPEIREFNVHFVQL